jgi:hypothetical protein
VRAGESDYKALKRLNYNLLQKLKVYEKVFRILRSSPHAESDELYRQIRAGIKASSAQGEIEAAELLLQLRNGSR